MRLRDLLFKRDKNIRDVLVENGYGDEVCNISEDILEKVVDSDNVHRTGANKWELFDGFELTSEKNDVVYTINLEYEKNEFVAFCVFYLDGEGFVAREEGYDTGLRLVYSFDN